MCWTSVLIGLDDKYCVANRGPVANKAAYIALMVYFVDKSAAYTKYKSKPRTLRYGIPTPTKWTIVVFYLKIYFSDALFQWQVVWNGKCDFNFI